jgi:hypothetical protein
MPLERIADPDPDFIDCSRGFRKKCLEIHITYPLTAVSGIARRKGAVEQPR